MLTIIIQFYGQKHEFLCAKSFEYFIQEATLAKRSIFFCLKLELTFLNIQLWGEGGGKA